MVVTKINPDFSVPIPDEFRKEFAAGQEVAVATDDQGRLVVTPVEQIRARLLETFGMWAGREDLPDDSIAQMDEMRGGERLDSSALNHEDH